MGNAPIDYFDAARLANGQILHKLESGHWPALQDACPDVRYSCDVCPIHKYCSDGNEFDCRVHGMFSGFYIDDEYLDVFYNRWDTDEAIRRSGARK